MLDGTNLRILRRAETLQSGQLHRYRKQPQLQTASVLFHERSSNDAPRTIVYLRDNLSANVPVQSTPNQAPNSSIATSQPFVPVLSTAEAILDVKEDMLSTPEKTP